MKLFAIKYLLESLFDIFFKITKNLWIELLNFQNLIIYKKIYDFNFHLYLNLLKFRPQTIKNANICSPLLFLLHSRHSKHSLRIPRFDSEKKWFFNDFQWDVAPRPRRPQYIIIIDNILRKYSIKMYRTPQTITSWTECNSNSLLQCNTHHHRILCSSKCHQLPYPSDKTFNIS